MARTPSPMSTTATDGRRSNSQPSHPLDELIWAALTGPHATLSEGSGPIRRYHLDVAPFGASREYSESALAALGELVRGPEPLALVTPSETDAPKGLTAAIRRTPIDQIILSDPEACGGRIEVKIERLTLADVPVMLATASQKTRGRSVRGLSNSATITASITTECWLPWPGKGCECQASPKSAPFVLIREVAGAGLCGEPHTDACGINPIAVGDPDPPRARRERRGDRALLQLGFTPPPIAPRRIRSA